MVKRLGRMGQLSSQISGKQDNSHDRSNRHRISDPGIALNQETSGGLEDGSNKEPKVFKTRKSRKVTGPASDSRVSTHGDGNRAKNKMRPISLAESTGKETRSNGINSSDAGTREQSDSSTSVSRNDDDQTTPKLRHSSRGQGTPSLLSTSKPSTPSGPAEQEHATTASVSLPARKRRFSTISRPDSLLETTPATFSQPALADTTKGKGYGNPPNKKKRTEKPAPGASMSQTSRQRQTTLKFPSKTPENTPSSSISSQPNVDRGSSTLEPPSVASAMPIGNWTPPSALQKSSGFYTPEEYKAMESFKAHFCEVYSISPEKFNELVQHSSRDKVKFRLPGCHLVKQRFWDSIYAVLPYRNHVSVARFMRRYFQTPDQKSHQWTTEEDNNLADLVEKKGPKWTEIAQLLGRTTNDVTQRWKNRVEHRDIQREGPWSQEECEELEIALRKCRDLIAETGLDVGTDVFDMNEGLIGWGAVSNMLGNTRSRQQCADKWRKIRRKALRERSHEDPGKHIQNMDTGLQTKLGSNLASSTPDTPKTPRIPKTVSTLRKPTKEGSGSNTGAPSTHIKKRASSRKHLGHSDYVRDYDSEEDSIDAPKEEDVKMDKSGEDHSRSNLDGDTLVPSTPLSVDVAQHPSSSAKLVAGSTQDQSLMGKMVSTANDNDSISTDTSNGSDRWSEDIESTHRFESPELGERRIVRSLEKLQEWEKAKDTGLVGTSSGGMEETATPNSDEDSSESEAVQLPASRTGYSHTSGASNNDSSNNYSSHSDGSDGDSSDSDSSNSLSSEGGEKGRRTASENADNTFPEGVSHEIEDQTNRNGLANSTNGHSDSRLRHRDRQGTDTSSNSIEDEVTNESDLNVTSDSSDDNGGYQIRSGGWGSQSGSEDNDNTSTMEPRLRKDIKLEPTDMTAPAYMPSLSQSSRDSVRPYTPSTPARNSLSALRSSYRLGSVPAKKEQSPALKSEKQWNVEERFEQTSSSSSDSDVSSTDESAMDSKLPTDSTENRSSPLNKNVPNRDGLARPKHEQRKVNSITPHSRDSFKSGPTETQSKANKESGRSTFPKPTRGTKGPALPHKRYLNQPSKRSGSRGTTRPNEVQDFDSSDETTADSEAGDIPF